MTSTGLGRTTFAALSVPNFRRYVVGQSVSLVGTWMQLVAQAWLVLELTDSATALGLVVSLQTLPMLVLGPYAGLVADRFDKRRLMMGLQAMMGLLAVVLGVLTVSGVVEIWQVYLLALLLGFNNAFEQPARQSFVHEIVGSTHLRNAVSLNSTLVSVARTVGPAVAGLTIAGVGIGACFLLNAASFVAVICSLWRLDLAALETPEPVVRARGQVRDGLRYAFGKPAIAVPLVMMALIGCLAYEFQVTLPVLAQTTFHGDATTYGFMSSAMGLGAIVGGLLVAARGRTGARPLIVTALAFGVSMGALAAAPNLVLVMIVLFIVGAVSIAFLSNGNSTLQLASEPHMRGRVIALWSVAFLGSTPIGAPIAGAVTQTLGARAGLALGAVACVVAAGLGRVLLARAEADGPDSTGAAGPGLVVVEPDGALEGDVDVEDVVEMRVARSPGPISG